MASLIESFIGATTYAVGAQVGLTLTGDPATVTWGTNLYWATNDQSLSTGHGTFSHWSRHRFVFLTVLMTLHLTKSLIPSWVPAESSTKSPVIAQTWTQ